MRKLIAVMALGIAVPAAAADISRFVSSEPNFAVNSWIVPTRTGVVVIDTQFTVSEAAKLVEAVKQAGRPLQAIIITHPHPDHANGTCQLREFAKVPVYATLETLEGIKATAEAKRAQWKPSYGKDYPDATCPPDHIVKPGERWFIDGVGFEARNYGPGEAVTESVILVPSLHAAFVGDLIYNRVHPWLAEGRTAQWLSQLDRLGKELPSDWMVYPGHGAADGSAVIGAQRTYISQFRDQVKAARSANGPDLTDGNTKSLIEATQAHYPGWPLAMLIPINAGAVARELSPSAGR